MKLGFLNFLVNFAGMSRGNRMTETFTDRLKLIKIIMINIWYTLAVLLWPALLMADFKKIGH